MMSPIPREISPDLVLVDPELASLARMHLPEPGWLGTRHLTAFEPDGVAGGSITRPRKEMASEGRRGWGATLLLTLAAASLAFNGFWLAQALGSGTSPSAQAAYIPSLASNARWSDAASSRTGTTDAMPPPPVPHTLGAGFRLSYESVGGSRHRAGTGSAQSNARRPSNSVLRPKRRALSAVVKPTGGAGGPAMQSLQWKAVAGATYYNLVLWRDGKRILDLWPTSPRVVVHGASVNYGPRARLSPGRYLWFEYPGFGTKPARHYGALAGSGVLVVHPKGGK
jgi:hypothetical protein